MAQGKRSKVVTENFKGTVFVPDNKPHFNSWIDKIFNHVDRSNETKYGFVKPSTAKTG